LNDCGCKPAARHSAWSPYPKSGSSSTTYTIVGEMLMRLSVPADTIPSANRYDWRRARSWEAPKAEHHRSANAESTPRKTERHLVAKQPRSRPTHL